MLQQYHDYAPEPLGVWPLSYETGPSDVFENNIESTEAKIGYDQTWTPAGMIGSANFAGNIVDMESKIEIDFGEEVEVLETSAVTVMAWIKFDVVPSTPVHLAVSSAGHYKVDSEFNIQSNFDNKRSSKMSTGLGL